MVSCDSAELSSQVCHSLPQKIARTKILEHIHIDFQDKLTAAQEEADGVRGHATTSEVLDAAPVAGKNWQVWCMDTWQVLGYGNLQWSSSHPYVQGIDA